MFRFRLRRVVPIILQASASECGLACLVMVARFHGYDVDLATVRRRFGNSMRGVSLARLIELAHALRLQGRPLRAELEYLSAAQLPCILHWDLNHFVVLRRVSRKGLEIHDPASGRKVLSLSEASKHFTGILLELSPGPEFVQTTEKKQVSLRQLTGEFRGLARVVAQLIAITFAIELISLMLPFQIQWVIDQVLPSSDRDLLLVLLFGFLIANGVQFSLMLARAWLVSWLGSSINSQWIINLFGHLMNLPIDFFEKRNVGDIVSRFGSIQFMQQTLTGNFIEVFLDGVLSLLVLVVLLIYSVNLTLCVLMASAAYAAMRYLLYDELWQVNEEHLSYTAKQQGDLMESIRGIQTIKLANRQGVRRARLANITLEVAARDAKSQRMSLTFIAMSRCLIGALHVGLISLGAYAVIQGRFTAGMLIAFISYADQFATRVSGLVDKAVEFRMIGLHLQRISDIALSPPEADVAHQYSGPTPEASVKLRGLGFRYSDSDPWVFRNLDIELRAGENVAIIGPSGCGKSTVAKLLVGLLTPTEGSIEIGGIDTRAYGLANARGMIGAVMQDDHLFAGTIAENICFGGDEGSATMEAIVACAKAAEIHEDIAVFPMGYESYVGDMGSALSGGQKQRVMLARALFRAPRILLLDEATSHLDVETERRINQNIRSLTATRIIIAHREESILSADRTIDLTQFVGRSQ